MISATIFMVLVALGTVAEAADRSAVCKSRNAYYRIDGNCDSYIECKDYMAHEMLCPDGLHYNSDATWPSYPCGYPQDVQCTGGAPQPAIPTAECPHQYGLYPSPAAPANECGQYRMCVEGRAIEMMCAPGLAFNPDTARCDWPELVPTCNVEAFLGFKCPPAPLDGDGKPLDIVTNHKYEGNCYAFYTCQLGRARLLTCDIGFAFDPVTGHCIDADKVICEMQPQPYSDNSKLY